MQAARLHPTSSSERAFSLHLHVRYSIGASRGSEACPLLRFISKVLVVELLNLIQQGFCNDSDYVVMPPVEPFVVSREVACQIIKQTTCQPELNASFALNVPTKLVSNDKGLSFLVQIIFAIV